MFLCFLTDETLESIGRKYPRFSIAAWSGKASIILEVQTWLDQKLFIELHNGHCSTKSVNEHATNAVWTPI